MCDMCRVSEFPCGFSRNDFLYIIKISFVSSLLHKRIASGSKLGHKSLCLNFRTSTAKLLTILNSFHFY